MATDLHEKCSIPMFFNTSIRVLFFHVGITALTQNVTHLFLVNNNIYVIVIIHLQMKRYVTFPTLHVPHIIQSIVSAGFQIICTHY